MKLFHSKNVLKILSFIYIAMGCFVFSIGFNLFVLPHHLFTGGVTGISLIIYEVFKISPAYTQWALNIPLFFIGWSIVGREYASKIFFGSLFLPLAIKLTEGLGKYSMISSIYLSLIFGGILIGLGLGMILAVNGSTGGLDIPARIMSKYTKLSLGKTIAIIDSTVIVTGVIIFQYFNNTGIEKGLYAISLLFIMTTIIDICTGDRTQYNLYFQFFKYKYDKN